MASDGTRPHERLTGLVALLHPASSTQIRNLTVGSVDQRNRALAQLGRPLTVAADPTTWAAVQACLAHRDQLATLKTAPHRGRGAVEQPWGLDLYEKPSLAPGWRRAKQASPSSGSEPTSCHRGSRPRRCRRSRSSSKECPATGWCSRNR
jgi:hypothetical protein